MGQNYGRKVPSGAGNTGRSKKSSPRKRQEKMRKKVKAGLIILLVLTIVLGISKAAGFGIFGFGKYREHSGGAIDAAKPDIDVQLLDVNSYSRPGEESGRIKGIVIHYTANPGATAQQNRDYFEGLKDSHETKASSHFIVGLDGEIIQCVPTWEIAYASNNRNSDTVSIECCHPDSSGKFNEATYRSMVQLTSWLCQKFGLTQEDVIRHYDVTGKICPKYFVDDTAAWEQFKEDVGTALQNSRK